MPPAKKPASTGSRKRPAHDAPTPALTPVPTSPEDLAKNLAILRDRLVSSLTLTTERLQDTVDDAVRRGRMTRNDAEDLLAALVSAGRAQTEALLADLEQLLGRGAAMRVRTADHAEAVRRAVDAARRRVAAAAGADEEPAAAEAPEPAGAEAPEPAAAEAPARRRRAASGGAAKRSTGGQPIPGYSDLTAAEVTKRLKDLTPAQLRKVRDYERKHGNRKSVLNAVERKLG